MASVTEVAILDYQESPTISVEITCESGTLHADLHWLDENGRERYADDIDLGGGNPSSGLVDGGPVATGVVVPWRIVIWPIRPTEVAQYHVDMRPVKLTIDGQPVDPSTK